MRVLHVGKYYEPEVGGMETHLGLLARGLLKQGVGVEVVVHHRARRTLHEVRQGVPVTRVGSFGQVLSTELSPALIRELSRAYDILHLHTPNPAGMLAYQLCRRPSGHSLVVTHHSDVVRQARARTLLAPLFFAVMSRARLIIATSRRYLDTSSELAPHRAKTRVIPYGVELARFSPALRDTHEARALRQRFEPPITLAAGRLIYYKGFEVLIDAFSAVPGTLLLAGEGPLRRELEERVRTRGLSSRVRFLGSVPNEDLGPYFGAADVFALPSIARSEAFGIVQIEAMGAGVPVVNTALDSGVPEVSPDGMTGLTVPPNDPRALGAALKRIVEDRELAARLGRAGRARALGEFAVARMVEATLGAYREALDNAPNRASPVPAA